MLASTRLHSILDHILDVLEFKHLINDADFDESKHPRDEGGKFSETNKLSNSNNESHIIVETLKNVGYNSPDVLTEKERKYNAEKIIEFKKLVKEQGAIKTEYQKELIDEYCGSEDYMEVNELLREGVTPKGKVKKLISLVSNSIFPQNLIVYRGLKKSARFKDLKVGDTIEDKGLISTTTNLALANAFMPKHRESIIFKINVNKGTHGLISSNYSECEVVLPPGSKLIVKSVDVIDNITVAHLSYGDHNE